MDKQMQLWPISPQVFWQGKLFVSHSCFLYYFHLFQHLILEYSGKLLSAKNCSRPWLRLTLDFPSSGLTKSTININRLYLQGPHNLGAVPSHEGFQPNSSRTTCRGAGEGKGTTLSYASHRCPLPSNGEEDLVQQCGRES